MRTKRIGKARRDNPLHTIRDEHGPHADCLITMVERIIQSQYITAWETALTWLPKTDGWIQTAEQALESVLAEVRPVYYGWPHAVIQKAADNHQLAYRDFDWAVACCRKEHSDLLDLMEWGHRQPQIIEHVINGVLLGYPLSAVENWIQSGCHGPALRELLESQR
jgi:hypothetical protein